MMNFQCFAWRVIIVIAVLTSAKVTIPTVLAISTDRKKLSGEHS